MCSRSITTAVSRMPGVYSIYVNLVSQTADILYNPTVVQLDDIADRINKIGFKYLGVVDKNSINNDKIKQLHEKNLKEKLNRLVVGFIFSAILMFIMFADLGIGHNEKSIISLIICIIPLIYVSYPIFKSGYFSLKNKNLNMDVMYSLGIGIAFIASLLSTFHLLGNSNFMLYDTTLMLGSFLMLGKYLEDKAKSKTSDSIDSLMQLKATEATVEKKIDGKIIQQKVDINDVLKGNILVIKPGEKIPADGRIIEGRSYVDESLITGESIPILKDVDDEVVAGSINKDGSFKIYVTNTGEKTVLSQIITMVQEAQNSTPPIQHLADKVIGIFIPAILLIAFISFIIWYVIIGNGFMYSLSIFISVVVVACPCALGLAIPTALTVGVGLGAKHGILIKDGETIEVSDKITHILFDKTGTITVGQPVLSDVINYSNLSDDEIIKIARSLEIHSQHPIAEALFNNEDKNGFELYDVDDFENISGKGIVGKICDDEYYIGNKKLIESENITISDKLLTDLKAQELEMKTTIIMASKSSGVISLISVADVIKDNSKKAIDYLHSMGIKTTMVSGDNINTSQIIAQKVGIDEVKAELLPGEKLAYVKQLQDKGEVVAFIGDGINDAPSLSQANVGIAIGTGTDVAIDSGDIILINGDLLNAVAGLQISKKTISRVKLNLFWAFAYNIILVPIAAGILYPWHVVFMPEYGALAMALSSVSVITLSLLLKRYTPEVLRK